MADDLKPAYLLAGSDRPKVERAIGRLRERFGEDSVERLSAREASGEDAVAVCNALGVPVIGLKTFENIFCEGKARRAIK